MKKQSLKSRVKDVVIGDGSIPYMSYKGVRAIWLPSKSAYYAKVKDILYKLSSPVALVKIVDA